jgi:hypothetical protein
MSWQKILCSLLVCTGIIANSSITFAEKDAALPSMLPLLLGQANSTQTRYCHGEHNEIIIESGKDSENYNVILKPLSPAPVAATGTRVGDTLTLSATVEGFTLSYLFTFLNHEQNIQGQIQLSSGEQTYTWNEWGVQGSCPTVDVVADGVPQFIGTDFVSLAQIQNISLFRSAAGHDYSDGFETCRSMKHYFSPPPAMRSNNTVSVFSPVAGTIVHLETEEENFIDDGMTNQRLIISPQTQPGILIVLFHVDLLQPPLQVGASVSAGQQLGHARLVRNNGPPSHNFDIALHANTTAGVRYISYFEAMSDSLFSSYAVWGGGSAARDDFIISKEQRDADPLTCDDGTFIDSGSLSSWYYNLPMLADFETPFETKRWKSSNTITRNKNYSRQGRYSMQVDLASALYSGVSLFYFPGDWREYEQLHCSVYYPGNKPLQLHCRIHDHLHRKYCQSYNDRFNSTFVLHQGWNDLVIPLDDVAAAPVSRGMDMSHIAGFGLFVMHLRQPMPLYIDAVYLR